MQIELDPETSRLLVKQLLKDHLPYKPKAELKEHPLEWLISNLYARTLRDWISRHAEKSEREKEHQNQNERINLLTVTIAMLVRRLGGKVTIERTDDGKWFEDNNMQLFINQNEDTITFTVIEHPEGDT